MPPPRPRLCLSVLSLGLLLALPGFSRADDQSPTATELPLLAEAERAAFRAVGRVNTGGYNSRGLCTGTLVAPDLVLTAAHCTGAAQDTPGHKIETVFVAGWERGEYVATRGVRAIEFHPLGRPLGNLDFRYDVALLTLERPITELAPLPTRPAPRAGPEDRSPLHLGVVGYQRSRPQLLTGAFDCPLTGAGDGLIQFGCPVRSGHSGAPVLHRDSPRAGWAVVGVTVARQGDDRAMAVPMSAWLEGRIRRSLTEEPE
ncbi:trypsin-like serine peptidase [Poseidonocella sedimentorum]|uniref:V8-like Glu-specific endopeptidase n=1 Tax=Poseidonocella sedimentorum TaxID=871652 RepID=A0A1I6DZI1_9RHOB|nr:serine protease [Poseidonocella sedimentorum]SFR10846.1 V8-like Glu-specific endopeptidase [Poseidonocella sedimentorum]